MSREIKFRGISQYDGKMVYGQLFRGANDLNIITNFSRVVDTKLVAIKEDTQGQYTGLVDCEGREIYEWDILSLYIPNYSDIDEVKIFTVDFDYHNLSYLKLVLKHCQKCKENGKIDEVKIVGNIYEHPHLLK